MTLSDIAIRRPVFTAMLSLAIVVFGVLSLRRLATDLFPAVDFPVILVQTIYPGAGPADIEQDVTRPIEDAIASISGIDKLQSFTRENVSTIVLQFKMGTDLDAATNAVRDGVGLVKGRLPAGAEDPVIKQVDVGALPVMTIAFSSALDVNATRSLADDRLRPFLEQVDGVGAVNVVGGQDREIQIDLDLDRLTSLGIPVTQVAQRLGYENLAVPVGQIDAHGYTIGIRADAQFRSIEDMKSAVVHHLPDGRTVRLGEVATVRDGFTRAEHIVRTNGQSAVALEVVKKSGANTIAVADGVVERLAEVVPTLGNGARFDVIFDSSIDIEANADEVWIAIYFGGAMAILVILFFLLDIRGTIISALALPTSIIGTFAAMYALGFSLNNLTLLGMSLAIGLLIDDAVVVRESITRRLEAGDDPVTAASKGTSEIALAVLATTFSLVAVFVPVAFMSGMVGQFFKEFGLTITCAVLLSLWVAFTLDPMLSARFAATHHGERRGIARRIERFLNGLDHRYRGALAWALNNRWKTVGVTTFIFLGTMGLAGTLPQEFMPQQDRGEVLATLRLPVGTSLAETDRVAMPVEQELRALPDVLHVYTTLGFEGQSQTARFRLRVAEKEDRAHDLDYYRSEVRRILGKVGTGEVTLSDPAVIEGLGDWPPLMIIVQGQDLEVLAREAERVKRVLASIPGSSDVRMNVNPGRPEMHVSIDRARAADMGVPSGVVAATARMLVDGEVVGTFRDGGQEAEIRLRADPRYAMVPDQVALLPVPTPRGTKGLGEVATVSLGSGASEINRNNRMRSITVSSQIGEGGALGDIVTAFRTAMAEAPLPEGYFWVIDGQARDMEETAAAMGLAMGVALLFIFMVLASQYESLLHPFTLLVSVPLALVGAILALVVTGSSISMGSQIGIILLMGLVTKNAILLVDGALVGIRDGLDPQEAMMVAGPRRLRPILMTSAAMVLGMLPTALGTGIGSEFRAPMGVSVIGGVISSTLLTLLVVPVAFVWMENARAWVARRFGAAPVRPPAVALASDPDAAK